MNDDILTPAALIVPKEANADIATIDGTAEIGSLFYDTDNDKLMFVKNGAASETITSG